MEDVLVNIEALEANAIDVFGRPTRQLRAKVRFSNDFTIIIDPADRNRNVGSSLDERCFRYAANMIKMFISEPDEVFFEQQPIPSPPSSDPHLFSAWFENKAGLHYTIVRDKLYRLGNMAKRALESEPSHEPKFGRIEFAILLDRNDNSAIAFHVEHPTIPATFKHLGPSTKGDPNAVRNFLKKHPRAAANHDGYYYTLVARDVTTFPVALESLITENLDMLKLRPCTTAPGTGIDITSEPGDTLRRQVIHVLASMVLPHMRHD